MMVPLVLNDKTLLSNVSRMLPEVILLPLWHGALNDDKSGRVLLNSLASGVDAATLDYSR